MKGNVLQLDVDTNQYGLPLDVSLLLRKTALEGLSAYNKSPKVAPLLAKKFNLPISQVILGNGAIDIVATLLNHSIWESDPVLLPDPGYHFYVSYLKSLSAKLSFYRLQKEKDRFRFNSDTVLHSLEKHHQKLVVIIDPHNPLGCSAPLEDVEKVLKKAKSNTLVILDQVHEGFRPNRDKETVQLVKKYPNIVALRSFSKFYAAAGLRLGFALCGRNVKQFTNYFAPHLGINFFSDELGSFALHNEKYFKKVAQQIKWTKNDFTLHVNKLGLVKAYSTDTIFTLLETTPRLARMLYAALRNANIQIKRFSDKDDQYMQKKEDRNRYLKITIGTDLQMKRVLTIINRVVQDEIKSRSV